MNLDSTLISTMCKPGTLVQALMYINGTQTLIHRIGKIYSIDKDVIILEPHKNKLIYSAYGGDIEGKYDIHDANNVIEIIMLDDNLEALQEIIRNQSNEN